MLPTAPGSLRLFRAFGVDVFVHWSWFVAAYILYQWAPGPVRDPIWFALTYLTLFGIVLLHEFGHALACKSVGGLAERIILWPLGGIAFVQPPTRPGPVLWSIAAGPLVNVALLPVTIALWLLVIGPEVPTASHGFQGYVVLVTEINLTLLLFNLLPIYPLDGGQILQASLWFFVGRVTSLKIAAWIGLLAAVAGGLFALLIGNLFLAVVAGFIGLQAWNGLRYARMLAQAGRHPLGNESRQLHQLRLARGRHHRTE